jgi:hypothetical protein
MSKIHARKRVIMLGELVRCYSIEREQFKVGIFLITHVGACVKLHHISQLRLIIQLRV